MFCCKCSIGTSTGHLRTSILCPFHQKTRTLPWIRDMMASQHPLCQVLPNTCWLHVYLCNLPSNWCSQTALTPGVHLIIALPHALAIYNNDLCYLLQGVSHQIWAILLKLISCHSLVWEINSSFPLNAKSPPKFTFGITTRYAQVLLGALFEIHATQRWLELVHNPLL